MKSHFLSIFWVVEGKKTDVLAASRFPNFTKTKQKLSKSEKKIVLRSLLLLIGSHCHFVDPYEDETTVGLWGVREPRSCPGSLLTAPLVSAVFPEWAKTSHSK